MGASTGRPEVCGFWNREAWCLWVLVSTGLRPPGTAGGPGTQRLQGCEQTPRSLSTATPGTAAPVEICKSAILDLALQHEKIRIRPQTGATLRMVQ